VDVTKYFDLARSFCDPKRLNLKVIQIPSCNTSKERYGRDKQFGNILGQYIHLVCEICMSKCMCDMLNLMNYVQQLMKSNSHNSPSNYPSRLSSRPNSLSNCASSLSNCQTVPQIVLTVPQITPNNVANCHNSPSDCPNCLSDSSGDCCGNLRDC